MNSSPSATSAYYINSRQNFTIFILLFKIVLTQLSTSFSGPRRLALAWISLFFLVVHASTSIFTTVGYLAALTRSSNRQYVVKKLFRTRIWMYFGIITKMCSASFRARFKNFGPKINCRINENVIVDFCRYLACNKE